MFYRELKNTDIFNGIAVLELFKSDTREEIPDDMSESMLDNLTVESYSRRGDFLSVTLIL